MTSTTQDPMTTFVKAILVETRKRCTKDEFQLLLDDFQDMIDGIETEDEV